ncbi:MAG TPA: DinB family protein [Pyrinomonadaceae bacterium]|nr:DinB family protein [Pyrinomonadaceae bacterium]
MGTIAEEDFTGNLFLLLKETFEGPPPKTSAAFLDQGCGLFQTVEQLTAEDASRPTRPGGTTVAAHCAHVKFYLDVLHRYMQGDSEPADWKQSWLVQTVSAEEWEALKRELRGAYDTVAEALRSAEGWGERNVGAAMAIVAHTAYHLGAVRQLLRGSPAA